MRVSAAIIDPFSELSLLPGRADETLRPRHARTVLKLNCILSVLLMSSWAVMQKKAKNPAKRHYKRQDTW